MVSKDFVIKNEMGIHMRPANMIVTAMTEFSGDAFIVYNGNRINAKSIMNIMAAGIRCGSNITVECDGADENAMLQKISEMIDDGFGE